MNYEYDLFRIDPCTQAPVPGRVAPAPGTPTRTSLPVIPSSSSSNAIACSRVCQLPMPRSHGASSASHFFPVCRIVRQRFTNRYVLHHHNRPVHGHQHLSCENGLPGKRWVWRNQFTLMDKGIPVTRPSFCTDTASSQLLVLAAGAQLQCPLLTQLTSTSFHHHIGPPSYPSHPGGHCGQAAVP